MIDGGEILPHILVGDETTPLIHHPESRDFNEIEVALLSRENALLHRRDGK
jgi:hypothetical protein